jgi:RND family efflux transporter MFP subunit
MVLGLLLGVFSTPIAAQGSPTQAPAITGQTAEETWLQRRIRWLTEMIGGGAASTQSGRGVAKAPQTPAVTASLPAQREIVEWDEYTARLEPIEMVEVRARVPGYLSEVHFKDGQNVTAGDRLYTIDPRPYERLLATARAELEQARTRLKNTTRDVERGRPLVEKRYLSERLFEERENLMRDARAGLAVAEARVKTAELELSFTSIIAPISGRMGRSVLTAGNFVSAGISNSPTMLTTIVRQDPLYVYFDVGENNALKYRRLQQSGRTAGTVAAGATVEVALPDEVGFPHQAKLDFSDNRLDPGTGTLRARAVLENKKGLFQPGMFARVRIASSPKYSAVLIPDEAIGTDQSNKFVYVVDAEGTAHRALIEPGPMIDGLRVVRQGIAATDWVIVRGIQRARPDQKVAVTREPLQISAAPPKPGQPVGQ